MTLSPVYRFIKFIGFIEFIESATKTIILHINNIINSILLKKLHEKIHAALFSLEYSEKINQTVL